jgi:ABC-2 type transport system ATP-binding protein
VRQLSLGERMKCELVAALLHAPQMLFLDEPTIGMDVAMQLAIREFIRRYNAEHGATVILTSHYMEDVAALCPRILVIDGGQLRFDGSIEALTRRIRPLRRLSVRAQLPAREALAALGSVAEIEPVAGEPGCGAGGGWRRWSRRCWRCRGRRICRCTTRRSRR